MDDDNGAASAVPLANRRSTAVQVPPAASPLAHSRASSFALTLSPAPSSLCVTNKRRHCSSSATKASSPAATQTTKRRRRADDDTATAGKETH